MDQAERLRNIIKNQNRRQHLAKVITVTSGKGGVGKSNISVNLAITLSKMGKRVVILDADFGLANIEIMLGIRPKYNLVDMMFHGKGVCDIIASGPENIGFISGGSGIREMTNLSRDQIQNLVRSVYELDQVADVILIDTGAGISDSVIDLVLCSSQVLLVVTPEPTSITDAYALLKTLQRQEEFEGGKMKIHMISNRTQSEDEGRELYRKLSAVSSKFLQMEMEYLGSVPHDFKLQNAVMRQEPVTIAYPNAPASKAISRIARQIINQPANTPGAFTAKGLSGLFARMFRNGQRIKGEYVMKNILIVDDSALMRRVLSDIIDDNKELNAAYLAEDGVEALEVLDSGAKVDAIVLDINMPRMDGIAFLKVLNERHQREKVLIVSTLAQKGGAETIRALELGAFDFITKPTSLSEAKGPFFINMFIRMLYVATGLSTAGLDTGEEQSDSETGKHRTCV